MSIIKIDEKEYDLDALSDEVKDQIANLQFVDSEIQQLNAKIAVFQTARNTYSKALQEALSARR